MQLQTAVLMPRPPSTPFDSICKVVTGESASLLSYHRRPGVSPNLPPKGICEERSVLAAHDLTRPV